MTAGTNSSGATPSRTTTPRSLAADRSKGVTGYTGPVTEHCWDVLAGLWSEPCTVQSNYAREFAEEIALLASVGWISTVTPDGQGYTRLWRLTGRGLTALNTRGA